jgi:uncharacterized protein YcgI (DUF1989 family)
MAEQEYDLVKYAKKKINEPYDKIANKAKAASIAGKVKLVKELMIEPYNGRGFELKKGQIVRYEIIEGPQIIDCMYVVKGRPTEEWADSFHSSSIGSHTFTEGIHFYSNSPWCRPLVSFTRDTVDNEKIRELYGELAAHSYVLHNGSCSSGLWEAVYGIPNTYSCHVGIAQGFLEVAGEEVARFHIHPPSFMHYQVVAFDKVPTALTYFPGKPAIKVGDFVELLAHEDLLVSVSPCPMGDQCDTSAYENFTCYPVRVAIYESEDGPFETAPDPQRKTKNAVDFNLAGRPGMVTAKVGKKD